MESDAPGFKEGRKEECPYANGDEFADAVKNHVLGRNHTHTNLIYSPDQAEAMLPHLSEEDKQVLEITDHELWSNILMEHLWSHEDRAKIVIAKSDIPLPFWEVRISLEYLERKGQIQGWLKY